jgi:hypothetical protein
LTVLTGAFLATTLVLAAGLATTFLAGALTVLTGAFLATTLVLAAGLAAVFLAAGLLTDLATAFVAGLTGFLVLVLGIY